MKIKILVLLNKFLYLITRHKRFRNFYKYNHSYKNNKIILIEKGKEKVLPPYAYIKGINLNFCGDNNAFVLELPQNNLNVSCLFQGNDNFVSFKQNCLGFFSFHLCQDNNIVKIGKRVESSGIIFVLHGDEMYIGDNCMLSNSIRVWTDGHSVIDEQTKELLNPPHHIINIGSHVWIGESVVLLKNAKIPSNSIIAHSSIVTKPFEEENIVLAGNPAKIVKRGVNWNGTNPNNYDKARVDFEF